MSQLRTLHFADCRDEELSTGGGQFWRQFRVYEPGRSYSPLAVSRHCGETILGIALRDGGPLKNHRALGPDGTPHLFFAAIVDCSFVGAKVVGWMDRRVFRDPQL